MVWWLAGCLGGYTAADEAVAGQRVDRQLACAVGDGSSSWVRDSGSPSTEKGALRVKHCKVWWLTHPAGFLPACVSAAGPLHAAR